MLNKSPVSVHISEMPSQQQREDSLGYTLYFKGPSDLTLNYLDGDGKPVMLVSRVVDESELPGKGLEEVRAVDFVKEGDRFVFESSDPRFVVNPQFVVR